MLGAGALGRPRGMVWGGRREEGSGWGTRVYLWRIHFDIWQNQYNIVKFKNKIKLKKKTEFCFCALSFQSALPAAILYDVSNEIQFMSLIFATSCIPRLESQLLKEMFFH